jgi:spore maturation protein CgeB
MEAILAFCMQRLKDNKTGIKLFNQDSLLLKLRNFAPGWLKRNFKKTFKLVSAAEASFLVSFEEIYDEFFKNYPPHEVYTKAISSRHFDAIGTKTCQIMLRGRFNDILVADQHYIALEKDYSNINDCVAKMKDLDFRNSIVNQAYEHVLSNHTYKHRVLEVVKLFDH